MRRNIDISIDQSTWQGGVAPKKIRNLTSPRNTDVLTALIFTALATRPPVSYGLSLSDLWAWLRYLPALANSTDLRLREEWDVIDPHQKAVLSDDLGVGFTTQLFAEKLDFRMYADTRFILPFFRNQLTLGKSRKSGPDKSPDFLALDSNSKISVLECKGSQSSIKSLQKAFTNGRKQKKNLKPLAGTKIKHSLVAGLFIPQWANSENALIHIEDPVPDALLQVLEKIPKEKISIGIVQIALAKHFALMGFYSLANALAETNILNNEKLPEISTRELNGLVSENKQDLTFEITYRVPQIKMLLTNEKAEDINSIYFKIVYPSSLYYRLIQNEDLVEGLFNISKEAVKMRWKYNNESVLSASVESPLGFRLTLQLNPW